MEGLFRNIKIIGLTVILVVALTGCGAVDDERVIDAEDVVEDTTQTSVVNEYCFNPTEREFGAEKINQLPIEYLEQHPDVTAVINGVYWGADDGEPQGDVWSDGVMISSGKGLVSGYFMYLGESVVLNEDKLDGDFIVGTHPLLVMDGKIHDQALDPRYSTRIAYRSALATHGNDICFEVSDDFISMQQWAEELVAKGLTGAINLDGGPVSSMALRGVGAVGGSLGTPSRLLFWVK